MIVVIGSKGGLGEALLRLLPDSYGISRDDCDFRNIGSLCNALDELVDRNERVDLICAAGRNVNGLMKRYNDTDFLDMVLDNLGVAFNCLRAFESVTPAFNSTVTLLSSVVGSTGVPGASVYGMCKKGIEGLVRGASKELAPAYRVNGIEMGYFDRGMITDVPDAMKEELQDEIPMKGFGTPEDLASACRFLIENEYMTGRMLPLTGGL